MQNNDIYSLSGFIRVSVSIIKCIFRVLIRQCSSLKPDRGQKEEAEEKLARKPYLDYKKCTGCGLCVSVCPSLNALNIDNQSKKLVSLDVSRCAFCGACAEICPNGALNMTKEYKLATNDKKALLLEYTDEETAKQEDTAADDGQKDDKAQIAELQDVQTGE